MLQEQDIYHGMDITYTMEWIYMLPLHINNGMLAIIAEAFIVESMLLIHVLGRYHGVHNPSDMHICNVHICMHNACQYEMHAYVHNGHASMKCACAYKVCTYIFKWCERCQNATVLN